MMGYMMRVLLLLGAAFLLLGCVYNVSTGELRPVEEKDIRTINESVGDIVKGDRLPANNGEEGGERAEQPSSSTPTPSAEEETGGEAATAQPLKSTNKTVRQFMDEAERVLNADFYSTFEGGDLRETTLTWLRHRAGWDSEPSNVIFDTQPVSDVKVNGEEVESLIAAVLIVYESGGSAKGRGFILADSSSTVLDGVEEFTLRYFPSEKYRYFKLCRTFKSEKLLDAKGKKISTYYFRCETVDSR